VRPPPRCAERFRPVRRLAEGGFGAVWLATQVELGREVALKLLHPRVLEDEVARQRFGNEALISAKLSDPHIVRVVDHGVDDDVPWIAFELIEGESLRARIARGRLPWREACRITDQIARALECAHAAGVLHRDIKPDNVLEFARDHWKVADFGVAKWAGSQTLTESGVVLGTPAYLSPVQLRTGVAGPESDLYALAITLYEMLAGQPPFSGDVPLQVLERQLTQPPPPLPAGVEVPAPLQRLLERALAKRREERYDSVPEFRRALAPLLDDRPPAAPGSRPRRATGRAGPVPAHGPRRTSTRVAIGSGLALLALGAILAMRGLRIPDPETPVPTKVASTRVEIPLRVRAFHRVAMDDRVLVRIAREPAVPLRIEIGVGSPVQWSMAASMRASEPACVIEGLRPDTRYFVRASAAGHAGGLEPYPVRTLARVSPGDLRRQADSIRQMSEFVGFDFGDHEHPDVRLVPDIEAALRAVPVDKPEVAAALARWGAPLCSMRIGRAVDAWRGKPVDPVQRRDLVSALLACGHPRAVARLLEALRATSDDGERAELLVRADQYGAVVPFDDLVDLLPRDWPEYALSSLAAALRRSNPDRARAYFLSRLSAPGADERQLHAALLALRGSGPDLSKDVAAILRRPATEAAATVAEKLVRQRPSPALCDLLAGVPSPVPQLQRALVQCGCASGRDLISRWSADPDAWSRCQGLRGEAACGNHAVVARGLTAEHAEVRETAAWLLEHHRVRAQAFALERAARGRDPRGVALQALARLQPDRAAPILRTAVAPPPGGDRNAWMRAVLAAGAAIELDAPSATADAAALAGHPRAPPAASRALRALLASPAPHLRPRILVSLASVPLLPTGVELRSGMVRCIELHDLTEDRSPPRDREAYAVAEAGCYTYPLSNERAWIVAREDAELQFSRSLQCGEQPIMIVVWEPR
jgi:hypothetical protein